MKIQVIMIRILLNKNSLHKSTISLTRSLVEGGTHDHVIYPVETKIFF